MLVGGAANYIVNKSAPEKQAAAYEFAKFLASPKIQSEWAAATGYVPVSKSAATMSPLAEKYAQQPEYKVAYDQLLDGPGERGDRRARCIGAYGSHGRGRARRDHRRHLDGCSTASSTPEQAVANAAAQANAAIDEYNSRVGESRRPCRSTRSILTADDRRGALALVRVRRRRLVDEGHASPAAAARRATPPTAASTRSRRRRSRSR